MSKDLFLSVANPCAESWDQMSPERHGRYCSSCSKTVIDFTMMTDQEVFDWLSSQPGPTCGRFHQDQLNRPLTGQMSKRHNPARYWHYLIAFLLSSSELAAQTKPATPPTTQQLPFGRQGRYLTGDTIMEADLISPPDLLHGTLVDGSGSPVSFATIMYKENKGVAADANGHFSIPRANLAGSRILTISAVGFEPLKVDISQLRNGQIDLPPMKMETAYLGGITAVVRRRKKRPIADTLSTIKDTLISCLSPAKKDLTVYPNPVSRGNAVTVTAKLTQPGTYGVQLFNMSGELLESFTADREQLSGNLSINIPATLPPGTYIVRLSHPLLRRPYTQPIVVF